jgi:toxin HigB-1
MRCLKGTIRDASIQAIAERKLTQLDAAATLDILRAPPGNRLEALRGDRKGQWSIRVNDQWRIRFHAKNGSSSGMATYSGSKQGKQGYRP